MTGVLPASLHHMLGRLFDPSKIRDKWSAVITANWHQGVTAFGGPPVHFQIFHKKFVQDLRWIDEQMYQELFGICQATPGPASTKMLFCINSIHGGFLSGFVAFLLWSLPGALGMYGLSLGIERAESALPAPAYALLSGLNAATVGIIALAAVQLAEKAITDRLTRILVFLGGAAGILYTALWYFPVLVVAAGLATVIWDFRWLHMAARFLWRREDTHPREHADVDLEGSDAIEMRTKVPSAGEAVQSGSDIQGRRSANNSNVTLPTAEAELREESDARVVPSSLEIKVCTWKGGIAIITCFLVSFIAVVVLRGVLFSPPRGFSLLANLYLAGTIIFGGGPVVVPLLREYVVAEGWVSPRNFLLGLAVIQAFPGPNFNFAVYLGSLATVGTPLPSAVGALIGYLAIFIPGLAIVSGTMGVWKELRSRRWLTSLLRGVNAMAVGLVYTAVFRLWQIGFIDAEHENGSPLGSDPWFVAVTATSFVTQRWFGLNAPLAILLGGAMGVIWYGVTQT